MAAVADVGLLLEAVHPNHVVTDLDVRTLVMLSVDREHARRADHHVINVRARAERNRLKDSPPVTFQLREASTDDAFSGRPDLPGGGLSLHPQQPGSETLKALRPKLPSPRTDSSPRFVLYEIPTASRGLLGKLSSNGNGQRPREERSQRFSYLINSVIVDHFELARGAVIEADTLVSLSIIDVQPIETKPAPLYDDQAAHISPRTRDRQFRTAYEGTATLASDSGEEVPRGGWSKFSLRVSRHPPCGRVLPGDARAVASCLRPVSVSAHAGPPTNEHQDHGEETRTTGAQADHAHPQRITRGPHPRSPT